METQNRTVLTVELEFTLTSLLTHRYRRFVAPLEPNSYCAIPKLQNFFPRVHFFFFRAFFLPVPLDAVSTAKCLSLRPVPFAAASP
jgi:hypothetical protein